MLKMYYIFHFACYSKGYLWYQNFCENVFSNYTNSTTNFFAERKPETFSVFNFNEEPYRELQSDNDQGQRNVGTLNKYAHGKQAFTFLLLIRKILPFSWK